MTNFDPPNHEFISRRQRQSLLADLQSEVVAVHRKRVLARRRLAIGSGCVVLIACGAFFWWWQTPARPVAAVADSENPGEPPALTARNLGPGRYIAGNRPDLVRETLVSTRHTDLSRISIVSLSNEELVGLLGECRPPVSVARIGNRMVLISNAKRARQPPDAESNLN